MQYLIMNMVPAREPDEEDVGAADPAWSAYTKAMIDAGVMLGGQALKPGWSATTLRIRDGVRDIHDGPFVEGKEEFGGFYLIDVPDLDAALVWAARNPAASQGAVEIRPVVPN